SPAGNSGRAPEREDDVVDEQLRSSRTARTTFTVRGAARHGGAVRIEVNGDLEATAALGFRVVMREFAGDPEVVIDLTGCDRVDAAGRLALDRAVAGIRRAGGAVA